MRNAVLALVLLASVGCTSSVGPRDVEVTSFLREVEITILEPCSCSVSPPVLCETRIHHKPLTATFAGVLTGVASASATVAACLFGGLCF